MTNEQVHAGREHGCPPQCRMHPGGEDHRSRGTICMRHAGRSNPPLHLWRHSQDVQSRARRGMPPPSLPRAAWDRSLPRDHVSTLRCWPGARPCAGRNERAGPSRERVGEGGGLHSLTLRRWPPGPRRAPNKGGGNTRVGQKAQPVYEVRRHTRSTAQGLQLRCPYWSMAQTPLRGLLLRWPSGSTITGATARLWKGRADVTAAETGHRVQTHVVSPRRSRAHK